MRTKHTTITATALLALATLTACTTDNNENPNPTQTQQTQTTNPTPTNTTPNNTEPIKSDPPKTEEEAIKNAETTVTDYFVAEGIALSENPKQLDAPKQFLTGQAIENLEHGAQMAIDNDFDFDGQRTFTVDSNQTTTTHGADINGTKIEFGSVHLFGCGDLTTLGGISRKTGEPIKYEGDTAVIPTHINVVYNSEKKTWVIQTIEEDWENEETRC